MPHYSWNVKVNVPVGGTNFLGSDVKFGEVMIKQDLPGIK
jgi:hypothetical protein